MIRKRQTLIVRGVVLHFVLAMAAMLTACKAPHSVSITWQAAQAGPAPIVGYNVYRGKTSGGPYEIVATRVASTAYTDTKVESGQTYYYVVTAVDQSGMESPRSQEIGAKVP